MEDEEKPPRRTRENRTEKSEIMKSETNEVDASDALSSTFEINPFLGKTMSLDVLNSLNHSRQRIGRSESIHNPILTDFWKSMNENGENWKKIKPEMNYYNLEERGFIRHLILEEKYDQALLRINETFPDILEKEEKIIVAINCMKIANLLREGKYYESIEFAKDNLSDKNHIDFPARNNDGDYFHVYASDYFSLIGEDDIEKIQSN